MLNRAIVQKMVNQIVITFSIKLRSPVDVYFKATARAFNSPGLLVADYYLLASGLLFLVFHFSREFPSHLRAS
jgi:hypothetical protein